MKTQKSCVIAFSAILAMAFPGCESKPNQYAMEEKCARYLVMQALMYENDNPNVPITNMLQLFHYASNANAYPHQLEGLLKRFGKTAGFSNSFYEKYAVPSGIAPHGSKPHARVLFINAQPVPSEHGESGRFLVWRAGRGFTNYWFEWQTEAQISRIFSEGGFTELPKTTPMPAPPPAPPVMEQKQDYPLADRVRMFFQRFAVAIGWSRGQWFTLLTCCATFLLVLAVFLSIWVGRRGRN